MVRFKAAASAAVMEEEARAGKEAQPVAAADETQPQAASVDADGVEMKDNTGPAHAKIPRKMLHPSQLVEGQTLTGVVTRVQDSFGFIR